jgi:hypothetical protein
MGEAAALEEAESRAEPLIFRGLVAGWPAIEKWAGRAGARHLAAVAGDAPVQVTLFCCPADCR